MTEDVENMSIKIPITGIGDSKKLINFDENYANATHYIII